MGTRVCSCVRVRSRARADDALMRGMFASATRSLRKAIHRWDTQYTVYLYICIHDACMYSYPCAAGYPDERIAGAGPPHARAHVLRPCARACRGAIGRARIRAVTCERVPSVWTAGGSARRRSTMRRRSTRTLARGTPPRSPRCTWYAPPFPARAVRHRRQDALGGSSVRRGPLCAVAPPMRSRV